MSNEMWLLCTAIVLGLLSFGWFQDSPQRWRTYALAIALATIVGWKMDGLVGLATWVLTAYVWIGLVSLRGTGLTLIFLLLEPRRRYRVWRKVEWSGEFTQPPLERIP